MRTSLETLAAAEDVADDLVKDSQVPRPRYLKATHLLLPTPQLIEFARSWMACVRSVLTALVIRRLLGYVLAGVPNLKAITRADDTTVICQPSSDESSDYLSCVTCDVLYDPPGGEKSRRVDVIFIHGLHGSLVNTWRQGTWRWKYRTGVPRVILRPDLIEDSEPAKTDSDAEDRHCAVGCACPDCYSPCWPKDWLPVDCPDARVIALNYTTDPYLWRPIWVKKQKRTSLQRRADEMAAELLRIGVGERPIVWVGHSKGGLFIKQMYSEAYEQTLFERMHPELHSWRPEGEGSPVRSVRLFQNTKAFLFFSVPHRGSALAGIRSPLLARSIELLEIAKDCAEVLALQDRWLSAVEAARSYELCEEPNPKTNTFADAMIILGDMTRRDSKRPHVVSFVETVKTLMAVLWLTIVSIESADAGVGVLCGVPLDHREICKPSGRQCFLYRELVHMIQNATSECGV